MSNFLPAENYKKKIDGLFPAKLLFFKIGKGGKFAVECVSWDNISGKYLFHLKSYVFHGKIWKIFNFGKIEKFNEE